MNGEIMQTGEVPTNVADPLVTLNRDANLFWWDATPPSQLFLYQRMIKAHEFQIVAACGRVAVQGEPGTASAIYRHDVVGVVVYLDGALLAICHRRRHEAHQSIQARRHVGEGFVVVRMKSIHCAIGAASQSVYDPDGKITTIRFSVTVNSASAPTYR